MVDEGVGWWASFERAWLDPVVEPFSRRAREVGWCRDAPDVYCDRCGQDVGLYEVSEFGCASCRGTRPAWARFVRLGAYEAPLSVWIQEVKFGRFHALGRALGRELGAALVEAGVGREASPVVVTPVPTSRRRRLVRGIDHAAAIGRGVSRELGVPMVRLLRRRHRPSQRAVAPSARASNVRGSIRAVSGGVVGGGTVVLVDDVSTSGATLRACGRALRAAGASQVWVGCVGVTRESEGD